MGFNQPLSFGLGIFWLVISCCLWSCACCTHWMMRYDPPADDEKDENVKDVCGETPSNEMEDLELPDLPDLEVPALPDQQRIPALPDQQRIPALPDQQHIPATPEGKDAELPITLDAEYQSASQVALRA